MSAKENQGSPAAAGEESHAACVVRRDQYISISLPVLVLTDKMVVHDAVLCFFLQTV